MVTNTSGKKKTAVARATVSDGEGRVRVNAQPVELVEPEMSRLKMLEPFRIAGDELRDGIDIDVRVEGGGISGQADAVRTAIARGIVQHTNDDGPGPVFHVRQRRRRTLGRIRGARPRGGRGPSRGPRRPRRRPVLLPANVGLSHRPR